jgi:hypothetical protein
LLGFAIKDIAFGPEGKDIGQLYVILLPIEGLLATDPHHHRDATVGRGAKDDWHFFTGVH